MGRLGEPDHVVLLHCLTEDRVILTENAVDFRKLVSRQELHPGLILLPSVSRDLSFRLLIDTITHLALLGEPSDVTVNHVLEARDTGTCTLSSLPRPARGCRFLTSSVNSLMSRKPGKDFP